MTLLSLAAFNNVLNLSTLLEARGVDTHNVRK